MNKLGLSSIIGLALSIGCANHLAQQDQTPTVVNVAATETITNMGEDPSPPILFTAAPPVSVMGTPLVENPTNTNPPEPLVGPRPGTP
ncbi:MAG: hypothetical protein NTW03_17350, partial [Verrucomicrobia bacterium]|nr:hypothetical protein [Verrucomicrobiota bacterium]